MRRVTQRHGTKKPECTWNVEEIIAHYCKFVKCIEIEPRSGFGVFYWTDL